MENPKRRGKRIKFLEQNIWKSHYDFAFTGVIQRKNFSHCRNQFSSFSKPLCEPTIAVLSENSEELNASDKLIFAH